MKLPLIISIFLSILLLGCEKDDIITPPSNTLEAKIESLNGTFLIGQTINLNGSQSNDSKGKPFQYLWRFKSKPVTSVSQLENANTANPKFTADKEGAYVVELKIFNQSFFDIDELSITVNKNTPPDNQPYILDSDINTDLVLTNIYENSNIPDYLVTKDIHVKGSLKIHPSVTIAFEENTAMYIDNPGSIEAFGAANQFTVFTGKEKQKGFWKGLIINSSSSLNKLDRVIIEYAGSSIAMGMETEAALGLDNTGAANLKLVSVIFQNNKGFAVVAETGTKLNTESFSIFKNNQKLVMLPASQFLAINGLSDFQNNDTNTIEIIGDRINASQTVTWSKLDNLKYTLRGKLEVSSGLIMTGGLDFEMEENAEISVTASGFLKALGTHEYPIKFHGPLNVSNGFWKGISIKSDNLNNELRYVEIVNAGSTAMDGFLVKTGIGVKGDHHASIKLTDTKIIKSGGYGLFVENNGILNGLIFTRFSDNVGPAVALPANEISKLNNAPALEFTGNGHDGVEIIGSTLFQQEGIESTWPALVYSNGYLVNGNLGIQTGLKILPGAIFRFGEDALMRVFPNGYINAKGLPNQKIILTGKNETKGFWGGILIQSNNNLNTMEHCEISYAGKSPMLGINKITSIGLDGDYLGKLSITNSKISQGFGYGIAIEDDRASINADAETSNIFMDLNLGSVFK